MDELTGPLLYSCCNCRNHVCLHDDVVSKAFQGRNGRAFLFSHAMNIVVGRKEDRQLMTGLHTVADIFCGDCREVLGWKYEKAYEETQKYKEGSKENAEACYWPELVRHQEDPSPVPWLIIWVLASSPLQAQIMGIAHGLLHMQKEAQDQRPTR